MVAPLAERRGDGLAPVYDRYAPALHAYCRSLLGEPADADDAVLDTFIIAAAELDGLHDPGRLRPWLYAVARNECRHRLRSRALAAQPDAANELTDETVDLAADAERAQLRAATGAALAGLGATDREIIELNLRHDLGGQDLADVLGVSVSQAEALVSRAQARFEASLGALLIARTGQESCPELAAMLSRWDGQLNVLLRKRITRHTEHCEQCSDRWRHELNPAMLLSMLPVALPPPGLRDQLFYLIDDMGPAASAYRAGVIHRAGPFGWSGFPEPLDPPHGDHRRKTRAAAAGVAVLAVFAGGAMFGSAVLQPHAGGSAAAAGSTPYAAAPAPSVLPELAGSHADQVSIETAQSGLDCSVLSSLDGKTVILGVLNLGDETVEDAEQVAARVRRALPYVPAERVVLAPDCGMKYLPRDSASGKLAAMTAAAALLRGEAEA